MDADCETISEYLFSGLKSAMKIALLTYSTKPRGGVIHTLELAEALHCCGQEVHIYALDKDKRPLDYPVSCVVKQVPTQPVSRDRIDVLIQQRIQEFVDYLQLEKLDYDCYHAQDCISANALAILRDELNLIPHFARTVHHIDAFTSPYLQQCQERSILLPDLCLCVSQSWQKALYKQYQVHALQVINGVNLNRFSSKKDGLEIPLKAKLEITGNPIYLTIGGIEPRKNSLQLVPALAEVLKVYPNAQLIIAGGETLFNYDDYAQQFFERVKTHNIEIGKSLLLPGTISYEDLPVLYRCADVFVFPSVKEGWGLVLLEAIASGLPVITSNQSPFTEFIQPHQGMLINPHDSQQIAEAMLAIVQPQQAAKLIAASQEICDRYSWEKSAQLHLQYYRQYLRL